MQAIKYQGYGADGQKVQGELFAASIEDAERRISAQEVTVIAIIPAGMRRGDGSAEDGGNWGGARRKRLSDAEAATILDNLALMAETGVPFVEALEALAASAKNAKAADGLLALKTEIVGGRSLSHAMRSAGGLFPPIVADMVRVAEEGGRLDRTLRSAAEYLERSAELKKRVMNAMMYPLVMLSISMLTMIILVVVVMPRFATIFDRMGAEVPAMTRLMLGAGTVLREHPIPVLIGLVALGVAARFISKQPAVGNVLYRVVLKSPILGELLRKLAYSRAFYSIGTLLSSNVPIISALEHGAKVAVIPEVRDGLMAARVSVEHGKTLSEALDDTGAFPATLLQMVAVGERTGRLSNLMTTVARNMERDVDARLKALVTIVEPVMIVLMGVVVGAITMSIIGPIYSVVQNIK
jgi:type IV pilus assembly protein PilC